MLTPKENYMRVLRGQEPEWVPAAFPVPPDKMHLCPCKMFEPGIVNPHRVNRGGPDIWGVNYVGCEEADGAIMPEPDNFILDDITRWPEVMKAPDLSEIDWEQYAKKEIEASRIDRRYTNVSFNTGTGYFQTLVSVMGFTNGLMAMYEEPEAVKEFLNFVADFNCELIERCIDYYDPDVWVMMDDTCALATPFFSMDMFMEFYYPLYDRQAKYARDRGLPIMFHNCGKAMAFMEKLWDVGVCAWDPAQNCNDLDAFKKKYGNNYVICGGWDRDSLMRRDVTDEEIVEEVRRTMYRYGETGGFMWYGSFLGGTRDPEIKRKNDVVKKAVEEIGHSIYKH